jgi:hypothetical protein
MQDDNPLSEVAGYAFGVAKALTETPVFASKVVKTGCWQSAAALRMVLP